MPKPLGPTIPRWQLGEELSRLRKAAGLAPDDAAEALGCSVSKIQKIEAGDVGVVKAELGDLLKRYGASEETQAALFELQKLGKQRGWWSMFGALPGPFAQYLGFEGAATTIRAFEPLMVHGLCQTPEYAAALGERLSLTMTAEQVEVQVRLKVERQQRVFGDDAPEYWLILDEAALHREMGGPKVMHDQLIHLVELGKQHTVQIVPFEHGGYPGSLGPFTIFDFDETVHTPVVYVEGQAGNLYMEREPDLRRCTAAYAHMTAAALSRPESAKKIAAIARQFGERL